MLYDIEFTADEDAPSEYRVAPLPAQNRPVAPCRGILAAHHARIADALERVREANPSIELRDAMLTARLVAVTE